MALRGVLIHIPPGPSDRWHGPDDLYNKGRPLFNQGKVDLVISGHTHRYAVMAPEEGIRDYPMVIGGGPKEGQSTAIRVEATRDMLRVVMTRDDGQVVGTYQVEAD